MEEEPDKGEEDKTRKEKAVQRLGELLTSEDSGTRSVSSIECDIGKLQESSRYGSMKNLPEFDNYADGHLYYPVENKESFMKQKHVSPYVNGKPDKNELILEKNGLGNEEQSETLMQTLGNDFDKGLRLKFDVKALSDKFMNDNNDKNRFDSKIGRSEKTTSPDGMNNIEFAKLKDIDKVSNMQDELGKEGDERTAKHAGMNVHENIQEHHRGMFTLT